MHYTAHTKGMFSLSSELQPSRPSLFLFIALVPVGVVEGYLLTARTHSTSCSQRGLISVKGASEAVKINNSLHVYVC